MGPDPWREATQSVADLGNVAFLTPRQSKHRRTVAASPTPQTRQEWADTSTEGDRGYLWGFEGEMVRRIYYNLEK